jgi:hypothetical protein
MKLSLEPVANEAIASILLKKSGRQYQKAYTDFQHLNIKSVFFL